MFSQALDYFGTDDIVMLLMDLTPMRRRDLLLIFCAHIQWRDTSFPTQGVAAEDGGESRDMIHLSRMNEITNGSRDFYKKDADGRMPVSAFGF